MSFLAAGAVALASLVFPCRADVTFAPQPLKQGQKITIASSSESKMTMSVKVGGVEVQKMEMPSKEEIACVVTVDAADAKGASAAKLVFGKCPGVEPSAFGSQPKEHACSGQTYETKRGEAGFAIAGELEKEAKERTTAICDSTLVPALAEVLGGKTIKQGETIEVPAAVARRAIAIHAPDVNVKNVKFTLDGERKEGGVDVAVFKVALTIVQPQGEESPGELTIDATGELTVGKSTLLVASAAFTETIKLDSSMDQGGQKIVMEGRGTSTWKYSAKIE